MWNIGCGFTSKCNMNCQFCYSSKNRENGTTLKLKEIISFVDLNNSSIDSINYGTGENSLSYDWFEFISYVRSNYPHISQSLTTNGYISQAIKDNSTLYKIFLDCIDEVDVSIDYCDEMHHNSSRGNCEAYRWALESIRICNDMGKKVTIVFVSMDSVLVKENINGLINIARAEGAFLRTNILRQTRKMDDTITVEKLYSGLNYLFQNTKIVSISDSLISALYLGKRAQDNTGTRSIRILPDGFITPATYLITDEWKSSKLSDIPLLDSFHSLKEFKIFELAEIPKSCKTCSLCDICCGGTYDRRILKYGSLKYKDPLCPFREDGCLKIKSLCEKEKISFSECREIPNIHSAYLPTIILQ